MKNVIHILQGGLILLGNCNAMKMIMLSLIAPAKKTRKFKIMYEEKWMKVDLVAILFM